MHRTQSSRSPIRARALLSPGVFLILSGAGWPASAWAQPAPGPAPAPPPQPGPADRPAPAPAAPEGDAAGTAEGTAEDAIDADDAAGVVDLRPRGEPAGQTPLEIQIDDILELEGLVEPTVITASRRKERNDLAPATVYVITEDDIRRNGYYELKDALESVPGFTAIDLGFFLIGGQRGYLGNLSQTLLLIDGREVQNLIAAEAFISHQFATHNVKQIEVLQGPGSALYGANAFAGAINIVTRSGTGADGVSMHSDLGTQDTRALGAVLVHTVGDLRLAGAFRAYASDEWDFTDFIRDPRTFGERTPMMESGIAPTDLRYHNDGSAIPYSLRASYRDFYAGTDAYRLRTGKGLEFVSVRPDAQEDNRDFQLYYAGWERAFRGANGLKLKLEYQHSRERLWGVEWPFSPEIFDEMVAAGRDPDTPLTADEIHDNFMSAYSQENSRGSRRDRVDVQGEATLFGDLALLVGYTYDRYDLLGVVRSSDDTSPAFEEEVSDDNPLRRPFFESDKHSVFAQITRPFWQRLHLTMGGRFDHQSIYGNVFTVRGGLVYEPRRGTSVKALFGQGFREPTIFEYGIFEGAEPNLDLDPARIDTYELSLWQRLGSVARASVTLFRADARDFIVPLSTFYFDNADETVTNMGVETQARATWLGFTADVNYTYLRPDRDQDLNVYSHRGNVGLSYAPTRNLTLTARANLYPRVEAVHGNPVAMETISIPGYAKLGATVLVHHLRYQGMDLSMSVTGENLLDGDYYYPNIRQSGPRQFLQPGRRFLGRLTFEF